MTSVYPYRHSTYFTGSDPNYTSELPPMNSMEDLLQDIFMRDRSTVYVAKPKPTGFRKVVGYIKNWKRDSARFMLPRSMRKEF